MTEHKTQYCTWRCYEEKDGQLVVDNLGGIAFDVRYCPFCGRKSTKKAKLKQLRFYMY